MYFCLTKIVSARLVLVMELKIVRLIKGDTYVMHPVAIVHTKT